MSEQAVVLKITGRVQGVGYRQWMVGQATARGLRGWVRNRFAGWVEALVVGPADAVEQQIAACRAGPATADVEAVDVETPDDAKRLAVPASGFLARGTA